MDPGLLVSNLTNPTLLFRTLGIRTGEGFRPTF
jgi:hypothetical protein